MSNRMTVPMFEPVQAQRAWDNLLWPKLKAAMIAGHRMLVEVKPETRSSAQNRRLWSMLTDISEQVEWYGRRLAPEDWKHVFTASIRKLDVVPNLDGTGFVALGLSTSSMTKREMCDLQELMTAFGAERGVKFRAWEEA